MGVRGGPDEPPPSLLPPYEKEYNELPPAPPPPTYLPAVGALVTGHCGGGGARGRSEKGPRERARGGKGRGRSDRAESRREKGERGVRGEHPARARECDLHTRVSRPPRGVTQFRRFGVSLESNRPSALIKYDPRARARGIGSSTFSLVSLALVATPTRA